MLLAHNTSFLLVKYFGVQRYPALVERSQSSSCTFRRAFCPELGLDKIESLHSLLVVLLLLDLEFAIIHPGSHPLESALDLVEFVLHMTQLKLCATLELRVLVLSAPALGHVTLLLRHFSTVKC